MSGIYLGLPTESLAPLEDWEELALCAQVGGEIFFPEKGESTKPAKAICRSCEVREECLGFALRTGQRFGIFGGYSERERRVLAKKLGRAA